MERTEDQNDTRPSISQGAARLSSDSEFGVQHADKPAKAIVGIGLLIGLSLLFYEMSHLKEQAAGSNPSVATLTQR